jgi:hypothetical protein
MKLRLRPVIAGAIILCTSLIGSNASGVASAVAPPTNTMMLSSVKAHNICGPSYHQTVKDPLLNTQDDSASNGDLLVNWSQSLHTWCLVGTSSGSLAVHSHAYWGSICLAPDISFDGDCTSTASKVYTQVSGLDTNHFVLKFADARHGFTVFNIQISNTRDVNSGTIYQWDQYVQIPPSVQP